ncbi:Bardet-Biedl syndrome 4 protein isoform X2 [Ceratina calcarata]|uniref:Bardet-Biedl syndrome 4 protein isoform X2 n=1 Tax=Ceratina calcarata TaxID=156304 RepID=A0AAJ7WAJ1_9HYME|nr:Bardet-Biedl syndrome 4 protein isoform X2 [Ceratina calcarata]
MSNNVISNGRIRQQTAVQQRLSNDKGKKAPEIPAIENNNWLLHRHYTRHEYKTCKILIDQELKRSNGHNEYANYLIGLILRREGKIQDSLNYFQIAYNINSTNVNNVKQIAKSFMIMGSHKRAVDAYLEAEKLSNVPDWEIYLNLGECCLKLNQLYEAKMHLRKSIELTKNEFPYIVLAKVCLLEDHVAEAQNAYTAALSGNPESLEAATELGLLYLKTGDVQQAFQQFGTVLAHYPNCTEAILPIAYIIQAISCLKRAHYLNPMAFLPAYNLGMVFLSTGQPASAAIYLCAAVSADPKNFMPYLLLGLALKRLDDLVGAEKVLQKAHALAPQDPLVLINYAVVLEAVGDGNSAAEFLTALNDIAAVIDVDVQITQMAKKLSVKLEQDKAAGKPEGETRILSSDEV